MKQLEAGARIRRSERPTIMDGKVVTFARDFSVEKGVFGDFYRPIGPFEVSASRNAVMTHRADCRTDEDMEDLAEAMRLATVEMSRLKGVS